MNSFKCLVEYDNLMDFPLKGDADKEFKVIQSVFGLYGVSRLQEYIHEQGEYFALTESMINDFIQFEAYDFLVEKLLSPDR